MIWRIFCLCGRIRVVEQGPSTTLEDLQRFVGGNIEVVTSGEGWTLWGHDESRLRKEPINLAAMRFVAAASDCLIADIVSLHGVMVLTGDRDGETVGVDKSDLALMGWVEASTSYTPPVCMFQPLS